MGTAAEEPPEFDDEKMPDDAATDSSAPDPVGEDLPDWWFQATGLYRLAFDDWPRRAPVPSEDVGADWKAGIPWGELSDEEVGAVIAERSNKAVEARLERLWEAVGATLVNEPELQELHATTRVFAIHNGCPFEASTVSIANGAAIFVNDAIADFAKSIAVGVQAWIGAASRNTPNVGSLAEWSAAEPIIRRVLQFEMMSLAFEGGLWQPFDISAPKEIATTATLASEWAVLFWIGHEFAHVIQANLSRPVSMRIGDQTIHFDPAIPAWRLEVDCDTLGLIFATEACKRLDYWIPVPNQLCLTVAFLAVIVAELRYYVRPGRHTKRFTGRFPIVAEFLHKLEPSDVEPTVLLMAYLHDVLLATDADPTYGPILSLIEGSPFVSVTQSQRDRPSRLNDIAIHDLHTRVWLASSARVQFCISEVLKLDVVTSEVLNDLLKSSELPPYDETGYSRAVYSRIELVRGLLDNLLDGLVDEQRKLIMDPAGTLTFARWAVEAEKANSELGNPLLLRVLHEMASDRSSLIRDNVWDDES